MAKKSSMINGESRQRGIRIPHHLDQYLVAKANNNPENKHNNISTEINVLIEADYKKSEKKARK